jgi:hypothetical protein
MQTPTQPIPVLDTPDNRMLTYTKTDDKGAVVIISVRASLADDHLAVEAMNLLSVPHHLA